MSNIKNIVFDKTPPREALASLGGVVVLIAFGKFRVLTA